jgi:hypothetical protein
MKFSNCLFLPSGEELCVGENKLDAVKCCIAGKTFDVGKPPIREAVYC